MLASHPKIDLPILHLVGEEADRLGLECYVIGGYVRDIFLHRDSTDIDVVVVGSGIDLAQAVAKRLGKGAHLSVFKTYGTAQVKVHPTRPRGLSGTPQRDNIELEFVGARRESYQHDSRNPIVEDGTLEDDQNRRDFTINAMAVCLNKDRYGELLDPFGGITDMNECTIRTPLDPDITYSDDPLRMMRAIRFATQLGFYLDRETFDSIERNRERIKIITKERIVEELNKILLAQKPSIGFRLLDETGLLDGILPQVSKLKGGETVEGKGHKENFSHTLEVLDNVAALEMEAIEKGLLKDYVFEDGQEVAKVRTEPNVWLRWAALFHDIGYPFEIIGKQLNKIIIWKFKLFHHRK